MEINNKKSGIYKEARKKGNQEIFVTN